MKAIPYEYELGDIWRHDITLLRIVEETQEKEQPAWQEQGPPRRTIYGGAIGFSGGPKRGDPYPGITNIGISLTTSLSRGL
jgi:hypothetical protein